MPAEREKLLAQLSGLPREILLISKFCATAVSRDVVSKKKTPFKQVTNTLGSILSDAPKPYSHSGPYIPVCVVTLHFYSRHEALHLQVKGSRLPS